MHFYKKSLGTSIMTLQHTRVSNPLNHDDLLAFLISNRVMQ
jgi:hypothetical protein